MVLGKLSFLLGIDPKFMLTHPEFDPVAFSFGPLMFGDTVIGPLQVHWYGIMYLFAFASAWLLANYRVTKAWAPFSRDKVEDLIVYGAMGVILGGRIGYVLFYHFESWLADPLWLLRVWEGGMSFHGGLVGVILAMALYARKVGVSFLTMADFVAPIVPLGLMFGRLGNFIGQELWGRPTDLPWGMVFPAEGIEAVARHPSQLYQAFGEGFCLFVLVFWFSRKPRPTGAVAALFTIGYSICRFLAEFARQPDAHIGFDFFGWLTRGQLLCVPMLLAGVIVLVWAYRTNGGEVKRAEKVTENA